MRTILTRLFALLTAAVFVLSCTVGTAWATPLRSDGSDNSSQGDGQDPGHDGRKNRNQQQQAQAVPNPNCTLIVPNQPLSALGLATPYQLVATDRRAGPCNEANVAQSAFVEATIIDPATGQLSVYRPLVIDRGTTPAIAPVNPALPAGAVVGVWFGFQGTTLTLAHAQNCVNGFFRSPFGQFAYCGAPAFYQAARAAIQAGLLQLPPIGTSKAGLPCPTTRDFGVVDQDQSDNVTGSYLAFGDGRTAQNTGVIPPGAVKITNGSDNGLVANFLDPDLGCTPFTAPDLTANGAMSTSGALNELQASLTAAPVALVPPNDPMVLINNNQKSLTKTNLYRLGVGQPFTFRDTSNEYCRNLAQIAPQRLQQENQFLVGQRSPVAGMDLAMFLQQRLTASLQTLKCNQRQRNNNYNYDNSGGN